MNNAEQYLTCLLGSAQKSGDHFDPKALRDRLLKDRSDFAAQATELDKSLAEEMGAEYAPFPGVEQFDPVLHEESLAAGHLLGDASLQPIFRRLLDEIMGLAKEQGISVEPIGAFGVLPIGSPNAMALRVPNTNEAAPQTDEMYSPQS